MEMSGQLHGPAALPLGKDPGAHYIGKWAGPGASLDAMEKRKFFLYARNRTRIPRCRPALSIVAIRTELPRLQAGRE
jgi:hypothetical protein